MDQTLDPPEHLQLPTAELLLDTRTPAELALSLDGSRLAFALHATVADAGSFVPSDLYVVETGSSAAPVELTSGAGATWRPPGRPTARGWRSCRTGSRPGISSRTRCPPGGEPALAATLDRVGESVAWSSDGARLLVLAADPGSLRSGLERAGRERRRTRARPAIRRPGDARRRLFLIDLAVRRCAEVGPPDLSVWEVDWDGDDTVVALVSRDHSGSGWYQARGRAARPRGADARTPVRADVADRGPGALAGRGRASRSSRDTRATTACSPAASMVVDLATGATTDPWPDLQTVGLASWCDDGSLWYARTDGTGNACGRIWLDGRREERWRDDAFIGDAVTTPACVITEDAADRLDDAPGARPRRPSSRGSITASGAGPG